MGVFLTMRGLRILRWCASFDHVAADLIAVGDLSYMVEEVLAFVGAVSDRERPRYATNSDVGQQGVGQGQDVQDFAL